MRLRKNIRLLYRVFEDNSDVYQDWANKTESLVHLVKFLLTMGEDYRERKCHKEALKLIQDAQHYFLNEKESEQDDRDVRLIMERSPDLPLMSPNKALRLVNSDRTKGRYFIEFMMRAVCDSEQANLFRILEDPDGAIVFAGKALTVFSNFRWILDSYELMKNSGLVTFLRAFPDWHRHEAIAWHAQAWGYDATGDKGLAIHSYRKALEFYFTRLGKNPLVSPERSSDEDVNMSILRALKAALSAVVETYNSLPRGDASAVKLRNFVESEIKTLGDMLRDSVHFAYCPLFVDEYLREVENIQRSLSGSSRRGKR